MEMETKQNCGGSACTFKIDSISGSGSKVRSCKKPLTLTTKKVYDFSMEYNNDRGGWTLVGQGEKETVDFVKTFIGSSVLTA
jgi:hypothetical protein